MLGVLPSSWDGPEIAAKGDTVYLVFASTATTQESIMLIRSFDGGNSFSDTIQDDTERLAAEEKSAEIIAAYHFLVSIAPETLEKDKAEYTKTTSSVNILDFYMENNVLYVNFLDGNKYEYFGVSKILFGKFINAKSMNNFGKRNIFNSFTYRKSMKAATEV